MTRPTPKGLDQVATILQAASRLATQLRRTTQASANRAVDGAEAEPMRAAIYARVSTLDQEPENQLQELGGTSRPGAGRRSNSSIGVCLEVGTVGRPSMPF